VLAEWPVSYEIPGHLVDPEALFWSLEALCAPSSIPRGIVWVRRTSFESKAEVSQEGLRVVRVLAIPARSTHKKVQRLDVSGGGHR